MTPALLASSLEISPLKTSMGSGNSQPFLHSLSGCHVAFFSFECFTFRRRLRSRADIPHVPGKRMILHLCDHVGTDSPRSQLRRRSFSRNSCGRPWGLLLYKRKTGSLNSSALESDDSLSAGNGECVCVQNGLSASQHSLWDNRRRLGRRFRRADCRVGIRALGTIPKRFGDQSHPRRFS